MHRSSWELLTNGKLADALKQDLATRDESFIVPHLPDVEVSSALRKLAAAWRIDASQTGNNFSMGLSISLPNAMRTRPS